MAALTIAGDVRRIKRDLRGDHPKEVRAATNRALNRANAKIFTQAKRQIAAETGVGQKHFKAKLKKYNSRFSKLRARTWMGNEFRIALAAVNKGKKIKGTFQKYITESLDGVPLTSAFYAKVAAGSKFYEGIFVRRPRSVSAGGTDSEGRSRRGRLPIREVVLNIVPVAEVVLAKTGNKVGRPAFRQEFRRELSRRMSQRAA